MRRNLRARRRAPRSSGAKADDPLPTFSPRTLVHAQDTSAAYSTLLRNELLGEARASAAGLSPSKPPGFGNAGAFGSENGASAAAGATRRYSHSASPPRNLFRFKTDANALASLRVPPESPYALSPVGTDGTFRMGAGGHPRRAPRKIARSPFKVLDAPALQDDFYLNLVDWSSHNVLAVGLGTCVYLWSACTSRVTKLCDLGPGDSVCSVAWTQRGTYLAVGTNQGEA